MKKPSILFYNFGAKYGGAEIVLLKYLEQTSDKIEFKVLLNEYGPFHEKLIAAQIPVEVIATRAERFYAIKRGDVFSLKLVRLLPAALGLFFQVIKYFKMNKFDLIVSNTFKSHLILGFATRFYGFNGVWRFHDILQREHRYNHFSRINILLMKMLAPSITRILTVSQAVTDSFLDYGFEASKLRLVRNGLDVLPTVPNRSSRGPKPIRIGWIGQFSPWKGIEEFLTLCKLLIDRKSQIKDTFEFVIAGSALFGEEEYETHLKGMIEGDYKAFFTFVGHISDVDSFYSEIDIYMHTSIAPDPFPTTILEAGSRGLLVLASELGGASEILQEGITGFLINLNDVNATLDITLEVLNNFEVHRSKGTALKKRIDAELNSSKYRHQFETELLKVVKNHAIT